MTGPDKRLVPAPPETAEEIRRILNNYWPSVRPTGAEYLAGAGGFSGARFWRITTSQADLCLRRWPPEHPSSERLAWIHSVLRYAATHGFDRVPLPLPAAGGKSWVQHQGTLWELGRWMPGRADYWSDPRPARLRGALAALAQFHLAVADLESRDSGPSPAISQRAEQLAELRQGRIEQLQEAVSIHPELSLQEPAQRLLQLFDRLAERVARWLEEALPWRVDLQPCLRDIWHDHVFFQGDVVTGFVDFGALGWECVAADVARLLGSLAGNDAQRWQDGLSCYSALRPLSEVEVRLVPILDRSGTLLGGVNWLDWIYLQHRQFGDLEPVRRRLAGINGRLEGLCHAGDQRFPLTLTPPVEGS